jgi:hypothetical protein
VGTLPPPAPGAPPPAFPPNPVEAPITGTPVTNAPVAGGQITSGPIPGAAPAAAGVPVRGGTTNSVGISREQDFGAVSAERSIEADAERLAAARAQRVEVAPRELVRPEGVGTNVISYAVEQARPVGAAGSFPRGAFASQRRAQGRCQAYRTADAAQAAFLEAGGPATDRLGVDPDGDGNACSWDPAAYRGMVQR